MKSESRRYAEMNSSCVFIARGKVVKITNLHSSPLKSIPSNLPATKRCPFSDRLNSSISSPSGVNIQEGCPSN